jgi:dihydroneopterin aldolase
MPDFIEIRGIRAFGKHGALPGERDHLQPFDLDLVLEVDLAAARASDDLDRTVDYGAVHARIVRLVAERSFMLLERLGDAILADLMRDERILGAEITLAKPHLLDGATPAVRVHARRAAN